MNFRPCKPLLRITDPKVRERLLKNYKLVQGLLGTACWQWKGKPNEGGYGRTQVAGVDQYVHRVSYAVFNGDIPEGETVDHVCHNSMCINPYHLSLLPMVVNAGLKKSIRYGSHQAEKREPDAPRSDAPAAEQPASGAPGEPERAGEPVLGAGLPPVHEAA